MILLYFQYYDIFSVKMSQQLFNGQQVLFCLKFPTQTSSRVHNQLKSFMTLLGSTASFLTSVW